MSRVRYLNLGPWPYFVGFTTEPDAFDREMRRLKIKDPSAFTKNAWSNAATHFFTSDGNPATAIICIQKPTRKQSKEQYAALVAHEATHVVQDMRDRLGELGREAEAYLVQQIVQEGLQHAWGSNKVRRREPQA